MKKAHVDSPTEQHISAWLDRESADWVVHKQKLHWQVGQAAMMLIKAIVNWD